MKNIFKWVGIILLIAIIGFAFIACDNPSDGDDDKDNGSNNSQVNNDDSQDDSNDQPTDQSTGVFGDAFVGTWRSSDGFVIVFSGGAFDGTYTVTTPGGVVTNGTYKVQPSVHSDAATMKENGGDEVNVTISGQSIFYGAKQYTFVRG
jgi:hypothetical protein